MYYQTKSKSTILSVIPEAVKKESPGNEDNSSTCNDNNNEDNNNSQNERNDNEKCIDLSHYIDPKTKKIKKLSSLKREELISVCKTFGLPSEGKNDVLRAELMKISPENIHEFPIVKLNKGICGLNEEEEAFV